MDKEKIKDKINKRFISKQTGALLFKLSPNAKLKVEYMYGNKYCLKRVTRNSETVITVLTDLNTLVDLMFKEKYKKFK